MTQTEPPSATRVIGDRVRELRRRHGWTAQELADACDRAGMPDFNRSVIANLENGRRASVSVEELFGLALALDVTPPDLIAPADDDDPRLVVPGGHRRHTAFDLSDWIVGRRLLAGQRDGFRSEDAPGRSAVIDADVTPGPAHDDGDPEVGQTYRFTMDEALMLPMARAVLKAFGQDDPDAAQALATVERRLSRGQRQ